MSPILGCIADDFTGATDLANMLVRGGLTTVQLLGVPDDAQEVPSADAIVIALKSRTVKKAHAVEQSLICLNWLKIAGVRQIFFKYCSTFDSTDRGNIGPVTDALMDALGTDFTISCPAFPETGRTIFKGHLFVGDKLLSDTHMRHHPLTPMTDSNLVSVLQRQTRRKVGLVPYDEIDKGYRAITTQFKKLKRAGKSIAIMDAVNDDQLYTIGDSIAGFKLITGGSGIAIGLPANYRKMGILQNESPTDPVPSVDGLSLVLSGSCSEITIQQVEEFAKTYKTLQLDPLVLANDTSALKNIITQALNAVTNGPLLIYSSAPPESVKIVQDSLGRDEASKIIERAMAHIAIKLVESGVRRLVVAGGETSGAVVSALGVKGLRIGKQIDPGIPSTVTMGQTPIALTLKSGNFGSIDFFDKALQMMP